MFCWVICSYATVCRCQRLELVCYAYLWRRDQTTLLQEMLGCGMEAVLVKVAGAGLIPTKHCGRTLQQMEHTLNCLVSVSHICVFCVLACLHIQWENKY